MNSKKKKIQRFDDIIFLTDDCRILRFKPALKGYSLQGHVLKTFKLQTESMCEVRCFEEHNCVSYNLGSWDEDGAYRCELSSSDHDTHPEALVRQKGVTYRPTEVRFGVVTYFSNLLQSFIHVKVKSSCVRGKVVNKGEGGKF